MGLQKAKRPQNQQYAPQNGQHQAISPYNYQNLSGINLRWDGMNE
jgi:hypothetical protein